MRASELWDLYLSNQLEEMEEVVEQDDYECLFNTVYKAPDGRYWLIFYTKDGQGNYHSWRDGDADDPIEVEPYEVTTTTYRAKVSS